MPCCWGYHVIVQKPILVMFYKPCPVNCLHVFRFESSVLPVAAEVLIPIKFLFGREKKMKF